MVSSKSCAPDSNGLLVETIRRHAFMTFDIMPSARLFRAPWRNRPQTRLPQRLIVPPPAEDSELSARLLLPQGRCPAPKAHDAVCRNNASIAYAESACVRPLPIDVAMFNEFDMCPPVACPAQGMEPCAGSRPPRPQCTVSAPGGRGEVVRRTPDNAEPSRRDLRDFDGFHSHPGLALGITGHSAL